MEITERMAICAAQHYVAAHESTCTDTPVDWGAVCATCKEVSRCNFDWYGIMKPLYQATGIYPQLLRHD